MDTDSGEESGDGSHADDAAMSLDGQADHEEPEDVEEDGDDAAEDDDNDPSSIHQVEENEQESEEEEEDDEEEEEEEEEEEAEAEEHAAGSNNDNESDDGEVEDAEETGTALTSMGVSPAASLIVALEGAHEQGVGEAEEVGQSEDDGDGEEGESEEDEDDEEEDDEDEDDADGHVDAQQSGAPSLLDTQHRSPNVLNGVSSSKATAGAMHALPGQRIQGTITSPTAHMAAPAAFGSGSATGSQAPPPPPPNAAALRKLQENHVKLLAQQVHEQQTNGTSPVMVASSLAVTAAAPPVPPAPTATDAGEQKKKKPPKPKFSKLVTDDSADMTVDGAKKGKTTESYLHMPIPPADVPAIDLGTCTAIIGPHIFANTRFWKVSWPPEDDKDDDGMPLPTPTESSSGTSMMMMPGAAGGMVGNPMFRPQQPTSSVLAELGAASMAARVATPAVQNLPPPQSPAFMAAHLPMPVSTLGQPAPSKLPPPTTTSPPAPAPIIADDGTATKAPTPENLLVPTPASASPSGRKRGASGEEKPVAPGKTNQAPPPPPPNLTVNAPKGVANPMPMLSFPPGGVPQQGVFMMPNGIPMMGMPGMPGMHGGMAGMGVSAGMPGMPGMPMAGVPGMPFFPFPFTPFPQSYGFTGNPFQGGEAAAMYHLMASMGMNVNPQLMKPRGPMKPKVRKPRVEIVFAFAETPDKRFMLPKNTLFDGMPRGDVFDLILGFELPMQTNNQNRKMVPHQAIVMHMAGASKKLMDNMNEVLAVPSAVIKAMQVKIDKYPVESSMKIDYKPFRLEHFNPVVADNVGQANVGPHAGPGGQDPNGNKRKAASSKSKSRPKKKVKTSTANGVAVAVGGTSQTGRSVRSTRSRPVYVEDDLDFGDNGGRRTSSRRSSAPASIHGDDEDDDDDIDALLLDGPDDEDEETAGRGKRRRKSS
ncbi:hypothetical protein HK101_007435, partial [Irineochytrium annulatum]